MVFDDVPLQFVLDEYARKTGTEVPQLRGSAIRVTIEKTGLTEDEYIEALAEVLKKHRVPMKDGKVLMPGAPGSQRR